MATRYAAEAAHETEVETSSWYRPQRRDPANVMGASKRSPSSCCRLAPARQQTRFLLVASAMCWHRRVRWWPLFSEQIQGRRAVTVTIRSHPHS